MKKNNKILFGCVISILLFCGGVYFLRDIIGAIVTNHLLVTSQFVQDKDKLYILGEINTKTLKQFEAIITAHPEINTLVFTLVPGSNDDETNFRLGRLIRANGMDTYLVANGVIASGGVDLFLAGNERTMETGGQMGVHSWSDGFRQAVDFPEDHPDHQLNLQYIVDMGVPGEFYWFTIKSAPAERIHWMSTDEIHQFQILTQPISGENSITPFDAEMLEMRSELLENK